MSKETEELDRQIPLLSRAIHNNQACVKCGKPWSCFIVREGVVEALCMDHSPKTQPFGPLTETTKERRERRKEYVKLINKRGFDGIKSLRWLTRLGKSMRELKEIELAKIWGGER